MYIMPCTNYCFSIQFYSSTKTCQKLCYLFCSRRNRRIIGHSNRRFDTNWRYTPHELRLVRWRIVDSPAGLHGVVCYLLSITIITRRKGSIRGHGEVSTFHALSLGIHHKPFTFYHISYNKVTHFCYRCIYILMIV